MAFNLDNNFDSELFRDSDENDDTDAAAALVLLAKEEQTKNGTQQRVWRKNWVAKRETEFSNRCLSAKRTVFLIQAHSKILFG